MVTLTLTQFGGHTGSFAGDCAVALLSDDQKAEIIIIDTGSSTVWTKYRELNQFIKAIAPSTKALVPVTLITTHFHADHYLLDNIDGVAVSCHVFSASAWKNKGKPNLAAHKYTALDSGIHQVETSIGTVACLVPPGGNAEDQNDQSLAVYLQGDNATYLSFGDMTKDAHDRFVKQYGAFPRARTVKYPHHGNFPNNYLDYFERGSPDQAVLISGDSGSKVYDTVQCLLKAGFGMVYLLARTAEAVKSFKSWKQPDQSVILVYGDASVGTGGVSVHQDDVSNTEAYYFHKETQQVTKSRKIEKEEWQLVNQQWNHLKPDNDDSSGEPMNLNN